MTKSDFSEANLDDLFASARCASVTPSADLMARIIADAEDALPRAIIYTPARTPFWQRWLPSFAAFGGLVTAAVAGLWIGANPALVSDDFATVLGISSTQIDDGFWTTDASGGFLTEMVDG